MSQPSPVPPETCGATWRSVPGTRLGAGAAQDRRFDVAEEVPVAFRYNTVPHAVMMATPADLEDFALGFSLTEGIALAAREVRGIVVTQEGDGIALDIALAPRSLQHFLATRRLRNRVGHGGCGICGLEDAATALPAAGGRGPAGPPVSATAITRGLEALRAGQALSRRTHGAHAAGFLTEDGSLVCAREDVGRHNAMDKLIGAVLQAGPDPAQGFALITSRCSVELVQKAVVAGFATLVAVSAPTGLAIDRARQAGLTLIAAARADGCTVFTAASMV